jgi:hypothetical protein
VVKGGQCPPHFIITFIKSIFYFQLYFKQQFTSFLKIPPFFYFTIINIMKLKYSKTIIQTILFSTFIWLLFKFLNTYEFFYNKVEIQTMSGSSPAVNNIMKDINSTGNQMLADAEYDKVDERILKARKF